MNSTKDSVEKTLDKKQLIIFSGYVKIIAGTILAITLFVLIPFVGWLRLQGQLAGWYNLELSVSLYTVVIIFLASYFIIWTAKKIKTLELKALIIETEKDFLLKIIEESHDFIGMADLNGNLGYHNPAAKRMLGFAENADLSQLTIGNNHSDYQYKKLYEEIMPIAIKQGYWKGETSLLHHDGYEIPVSLICICHKDKQGNPVSLSAIMRDISEEKELRNLMAETEKTAMANEFRWKFAVEGAGDGLWDWDVENNEVFFSKQWKSMLGFANHEIENIFEEWEKRLHPDDKSNAMLDIQHYLEGKTEHYSNEHRLLCKDGTYKWILDRGMIVSRDETGKPLRLLGTHTDISERKNIENVLREAKRIAELLAQSKADFLSNMSHEIRTPLNAILGLAFVLEKSQLAEDDKSLVHKIQCAGKSLLAIINQVLDISKIEAGKFELEITTFNLDDILDNLVTIMTFNADDKNLDLIIHPLISHRVYRLKGDAPRLQQVLVNLVSNAIKFTHQGQVTVTVTEQDINEQQVFLNFSVSDTGDGISKEAQKNIFMPFSQADNSIARRYGGTGLGLSISAQLVKLMGGDIMLSSEMGKGSCFSFGLHFDIEAEVSNTLINEDTEVSLIFDKTMQEHETTEPKKPLSNVLPLKRLEGITLLVVDDNDINLEVASLIFRAEGAVVTGVDNGKKAVDYLKNNIDSIDLVLMDIQMPIMDGYQATRLIRQIPELIDLPIVALSAGVFKSQIEKAKFLGIYNFITKPFDVDVAVNLIVKLARKTDFVKENQETPLIEKPLSSNSQLSGVDIEYALKIWGDIDIYKPYLVKFFQDCQSLKIITDTNSKEFTALIHNIKGSAKMLGLIEISDIAHEIYELIANNQDANEIVGRLKIAIEAAQNFTHEYTSAKQNSESVVKDFDGKIISELLTVVLQAVERDSPDGLTVTLNELSEYLTAERIEPVKLALDFFDFPLAKSEVIKLANECNLSLGSKNV